MTASTMGKNRLTGQVVNHPSDIFNVGRKADLDMIHFVLLARLILNHWVVSVCLPLASSPEVSVRQGEEVRTVDKDIDRRFGIVSCASEPASLQPESELGKRRELTAVGRAGRSLSPPSPPLSGRPARPRVSVDRTSAMGPARHQHHTAGYDQRVNSCFFFYRSLPHPIHWLTSCR